MKLNKFKTIAPAAALLLAASMSSCMDDLNKGNIDPNVDPNPNITGLYSKCYAGLIMEGNDGKADFTIDDDGKSTLLRNLFNFNEVPTDEAVCWWSDGGIADVSYNKFDAGNATLKNLYYRLMSNISYENHFLSLDAAKAEKTKYAEVRVLRAYSYFLMLDFFGDPTFIDNISAETPRQAHTYNSKFEEGKSYTRAELLQMGREFLFGWVEKELLKAEPDLLEAKAETSDTDPNYGRIDKVCISRPIHILTTMVRTILIGTRLSNMPRRSSILLLAMHSSMTARCLKRQRLMATSHTTCSSWATMDRMVQVARLFFH